MHFRCSECSRPIGAFFDSKGKPELFKCPHSGRIAHCIPDRRVARSTPPLPKWLTPVDISILAKRRKAKTVEDL